MAADPPHDDAAQPGDLAPPRLIWQDDGLIAPHFGDRYFSAQGGLAETRAVFLEGCGLPARFAGRRHFAVGELGFGTGLNALALWQLWRSHRPAGARLTLLSTEAHPLPLADAARAHAAFPELSALAARLHAQWPAAAPGAQLCDFPDDGFRLIVCHGDALAALEQVDGRFDAWFLDGFAPAANPAMWSPALMRRVAELSAPGAVAATFTVAGAVRRALADAGFTVEKRPGFGRKRERLEARIAHPPAPASTPDRFARVQPAPGPALILGGGIAGSALARALAHRGIAATIVSHGAPASLPPAALLTPRLEAAHRPHAAALFAAFRFAAALYDRLGGLSACGALRTALDPPRAARLAELWPGLEVRPEGLWIPRAGVLRPQSILDALRGETPVISAHVAAIAHGPDGWQLLDADGARIASAPLLLLAGGGAGRPLARVPLSATGGQLSLHAAPLPIPHIVSWGRFAAPLGSAMLLGSSHTPLAADAFAPLPPDPARARSMAAEAEQATGCALSAEASSIWTGVRAATPDRLPVVGPMVAPSDDQPGNPAAPVDGLLILSGLGARGFAHAPLLAEQLAADLAGEPSPMLASARHSLHPSRFVWRAERRNPPSGSRG